MKEMQYSCLLCRDRSLSSHYYYMAHSVKCWVISKENSHFESGSQKNLIDVYFNHFQGTRRRQTF